MAFIAPPLVSARGVAHADPAGNLDHAAAASLGPPCLWSQPLKPACKRIGIDASADADTAVELQTMTSTSPKHFPVSWEELHRNAKALAWRLVDMGPWKGLIAVTRGGLVPAAIVARELDIRMIETISIVGYKSDNSQADRVEIVKYPSDVDEGKGWLIVDDLVDTGRTATVLRALLPMAHFATVYAKPLGRPLVDTFVTEVSQDTWIYFPWDVEPQFTQPIVNRRNDRA